MATIRTHTTLRTLFAATAVFAVLAAMWTAAPNARLLHGIVTPCALCFLCALFGMPFSASLIVGFATMVALTIRFHAAYDFHAPHERISGAPVILFGIKQAIAPSIVFGAFWLSWSWWGMYLRYVWSMPRGELDARISTAAPKSRKLTLRERMLVRCSYEPVGFFMVTLMAHVWLVLIVIALKA